MRVLIVDDDADVRDFIERALEVLGYDVTARADAAGAMAAVASGFFPLILLDWVMPGTDGLELCRRIRASPGGELPVVLIFTGRDEPDDLRKVLAAGADDYMTKPIDVDHLTIRLTIAEERARQRAERRRAEEKLRASEERFALAARGANDGVWDWDLATGEIYYSERWKAMLGYSEDEIGDRVEEWYERIHPADRQRVESLFQAHLEGREPHFECSHRLRQKDDTYRWIVSRGLAVRDGEGKACRMAGSLTDITGRGVHDQLTGLPNRRLFSYRLDNALRRRQRRPEYLFGVLLFGLDRFTMVNDSLGHAIGDELLIAVGRRLEGSLRATDILARLEATLARFGGDEFILLVEDLHENEDVIRASERFQKIFEAPFELDGNEVFASASVGIALGSTNYDRPEDMMRDADLALHRAKALGGSRFEIFDETMHQRAVTRLRLENDLRRAGGGGQFRVLYQPIVSLDGGRLVGFEALLRWQHPEKGLISPAEFLSVAEESKLITLIDRWMLNETCRQMVKWQAALPAPLEIAMNVNLSSKQFAQTATVAEVRDLLERTGLPGRLLKLEITESLIMREPDTAAEVLRQLKALGVQICLDDFGTGYSSLSYLHRFPLDTLKIDRSFVADVEGTGGGQAIVQAIVTLGHGLGMDVVAEGVETEGQRAELERIGCDHAQGYFFSRPVTSEEALELFLSPRRAN
jgi:diguanylate cyclase (GGDEF)-like protein/PAS domain S-box-containing protein